uniref:Uncharacterized protein n=1 Tax=Anopheles coluzzii TaxID=1518534 RepID=A0A8W7P854_ANOCL
MHHTKLSNGGRYLLDHLNRPIRAAEVDSVRGGPVAVIPVTVGPTRTGLHTQSLRHAAAAGRMVLQPVGRIRWQLLLMLVLMMVRRLLLVLMRLLMGMVLWRMVMIGVVRR